MVGLARRADHARSAGPRDLDGGDADPAGRAVDDERLPLADAAEEAEDAQARLDRDGQRGRLLPRQAGGLAGEVVEHGLLGRGAADGEAEDLVARGDAAHVRPDLVDDARRLPAVDDGELQRHDVAHHPAARLPVDRVDARRAHGDADLPRPRPGRVGVGDVQDVGIAVLGERDRLHERTLLTAARRPAAAVSARARIIRA